MPCFDSETLVPQQPDTLLTKRYRKHNGAYVMRCRFCHLGFSGSNMEERAKLHVTRSHWDKLAEENPAATGVD